MLDGLNRRILPLVQTFELFQAELKLGAVRVVVTGRPPCISEGFLEPELTGIGWQMDDPVGMRLDGISLERPVLMTHGLELPHRIYQPRDMTIGAVFLEEDGSRGWPERQASAQVIPIRAEALDTIRATVRELVLVASHEPERFLRPAAVSGMEQSLLGAIDHAFATAPGEELPALAIGNYLKICHRADDFIRASGSSQPSSAEVAAAAGVTIRTLHNAMIAVNGMSLRRFMIHTRLWAVRNALLRAGPGTLVKTVALDHGFWHLGRFAQIYTQWFGESPSETVRRVRAT